MFFFAERALAFKTFQIKNATRVLRKIKNTKRVNTTRLFVFFSNVNAAFCLVLDPRVSDWPMMSSPLPTLGICMFYAYFSKVLGPKIMENRKPLNLRGVLVVYNLIQTIFSAWIFYEVNSATYALIFQLFLLIFYFFIKF